MWRNYYLWVLVVMVVTSGGARSTTTPSTLPRGNGIGKLTTAATTTTTSAPRHHKDNNDETDSEESGETAGQIIASQNDANKFVDELLEKYRARLISRGLDKLALPAESKDFSKKILGFRFHGDARLYNGTLTGLDSVRRVHDAEINTFVNGSTRLDVDVEFKDLRISYKYKLRINEREAQQNLSGFLSSVIVHLRVRVQKDGHVALDLFEIKESGDLRVQTRGFGPFNNVISSLAEVLGTRVKRVVLECLQGKIHLLFNSVVNESLYSSRALVTLSQTKESVFLKFLRMTKVNRGFFGSKK